MTTSVKSVVRTVVPKSRWQNLSVHVDPVHFSELAELLFHLLQVLSLLVVQAHLDVCLGLALFALVLHFSDLIFPLLRFLLFLLLLLPKLSYPSFENFIDIVSLLSHFYTLLALDIGILRLKVGQCRHNKV